MRTLKQSRTLRYGSADAQSVTPRLGLTEAIRTSRSGSRYGSGRSNTALTTLKIAVFAPDAEREREHGRGGEAGVLQQLAEG